MQLNNNFRLSAKKDWFFGVNYQMVSPQQIELGRLELLQNFSLNLKKLHKNWTFMFEANDIFRTYNIQIEKREGSKYNKINQYEYLQQFGISTTFNFVNQKLKKTRTIDAANDEVRKRTGN